jgi:hypothetical protein
MIDCGGLDRRRRRRRRKLFGWVVITRSTDGEQHDVVGAIYMEGKWERTETRRRWWIRTRCRVETLLFFFSTASTRVGIGCPLRYEDDGELNGHGSFRRAHFSRSCHADNKALFSSQKRVKNGTVALSFLFDKYCLIIE